MTSIRRRYTLAWAAASILVFVAWTFGVATGQGDPTAGQAPSGSPQYPQDTFAGEMALAESAADRDSRVLHLRKALSLRPNDPANIAIEFQIGIELSQRIDPEHKQGPRPAEALPVFEHILAEYRHMDYYDKRPMDRSNSPQLMVPWAAILVACLDRKLDRDSTKARELLISAMEMFEQTYDRRVDDWANEPPEPRPRDDDPFRGGAIGISKWESRRHSWEQRKKDAAEGNVFGPLEMAIVGAAVRQFGYSFGPQQPFEVPPVMGRVVEMFPGTPMAKVAEEHIRRASELAEKDLLKELSKNVENLPSQPDPEPVAEADGPAELPGSPPAPVTARRPHEGSWRLPAPSDGRRYYWALGLAAIGVLMIPLVLSVYRRRRTS